jgi:hypothetical protein
MTEPPREIGHRRTYMRGPLLVAVLLLEPWHALGEFFCRRRKCDAVAQIGAAIAERK